MNDGGGFNNPERRGKGFCLIVESSEFIKDSISMTLIEGREMQKGTTGLNQRKVKFTSCTPVCISSSRINHQLDSVNCSCN